MTQEFHISVTPVGNDEYLVRTEKVAPGVPLAEEQLRWDVDGWLAQARQLMNDPLLGLLQGNRLSRVGGFDLPQAHRRGQGEPESSELGGTLIGLGETLYNSLFQGTLWDSWMMARGIAQHQGEMLRLRLGLKGLQLPRLPWEVLNGGDRDGNTLVRRPIATGTDVLFSRFQPSTGRMGNRLLVPLEPDQPVRILMVIAAPSDQEQLELEREAANLQEELCRPRNPSLESFMGALPELHLTMLNQPGREELTQALEQGHFHVLHYAGHSNLGVDGGNLYLVNPKTGLTEILSGDDLAGLLANNGIRMVVFNSCRGTHTAVSADAGLDPQERNLAEALVSQGIPAVLAMAERIPDDVALTLTRLFYRNLRQGYPVDLSLSRARQGLISAYGSHQLYWALPVLYLHPECDGYLLQGDRSLVNPADRLLQLPQLYDIHPILAGEEQSLEGFAPELDSDDDLEIISRAVLLEDDLALLTSEADYTGRGHPGTVDFDEGDDLTYEADAPVMAELIRQLTPQLTESVQGEAIAPGEVSLAETHTSTQGTYQWLSKQLPRRFPPSRASVLQPRTPAPADLPSLTNLTSTIPTALDTSPAPVDHSLGDQGSARWGAPTRHRGSHRFKSQYLILPLVGAGVMAIAVLIVQTTPRIFNLGPTPHDLLPPSPGSTFVLPINFERVNLQTADVATVEAIASHYFRKQDLPKAEQAFNALLDRGALQAADSAFKSVSKQDLSEPSISFLRGKLAWQAVKQGSPDYYSVTDAQRFWEAALKKRPDSVSYHNALGFAYYEQGKSRQALNEWCTSIALLAGNAAGSPGTSDNSRLECAMPAQPITNPDAITAYAGIALALQQAVANPDYAAQQKDLVTRATQLYQVVVQSSPASVEPDELSKSWLWNEKAIRDWQTLGTL